MSNKVSCRKTFTKTLLNNARKQKDIFALATDSAGSVTLGNFIKELPNQYVELGIAEQNAVTIGAGLASVGKNVFVCGPACFLSARAFEQIKVDVAYNKSNVKVIGVSAGVSYGPLGGTHTTLHDIAGARALPNLHIYVPADAHQTEYIIDHLCRSNEPAYVRMGRGDVNAVYEDDETFEIGKAKIVCEGDDLSIVACGEMVYPAKLAVELLKERGVNARLLDIFCIKPFDEKTIVKAARETGAIVTVEEHSMNGGLGELVAHTVAENCPVPMKVMGFPDEEVMVGNSVELFQHYGFTPMKIAEKRAAVDGEKNKMAYILAIDQSTSGTKGLVFNPDGELISRYDLPHKQITNALGYIEHDPEEIYRNTIEVVKGVLIKSAIPKNEIGAVGISNQRETVLGWNAQTGESVYNAIVWQCGRAAALCKEFEHRADFVFETTGLNLSPYFSGPKIAWMIRNVPNIGEMLGKGYVRFGTIDAWLIYKLTNGESYKTDYSNASRTGLMNIDALEWDHDMMALYGLNETALPEICGSDSVFGYTDFEGLLPKAIPICGVMGDSHAALFANGCSKPGMAKVTFGTGSSVMMNVGGSKVSPKPGIVASLAWGREGKVQYVLEGNINYSGAVIKWLVDDVKLIQNAEESDTLSKSIKSTGGVYLVPAFTGLGAPYWNNEARAILFGMNPTTKKAHIVRAATECIAYQIKDVFEVMKESFGRAIPRIFGDGGATKNEFLMNFVSGILGIPLEVSGIEELSGAGAAYMAAISSGISCEERLFSRRNTQTYVPRIKTEENEALYNGWKQAVEILSR